MACALPAPGGGYYVHLDDTDGLPSDITVALPHLAGQIGPDFPHTTLFGAIEVADEINAATAEAAAALSHA